MKKIFVVFLAFSLLCCTAFAAGAGITVTAQTHVGDFGREALTFTISGVSEEDAALIKAEDFIIANDYVNPANTVENQEDVTAVEYVDGNLVLSVAPFRYNPSPFVVTYTGEANVNLSFTKEQVSELSTAIADEFTAEQYEDMYYRLYIPEDAEGPLPLVVWHHGAGSIGDDNFGQVVNLFGATAYIEMYGDVVVLAPQCQKFEDGTNQDWMDILPEIRAVIESLIADGTVDASRVYGTGCSFGGHGVIMDAAYNADLFAAINICCPALNENNIPALLSLTDMGVYLTTSPMDGTLPNYELCEDLMLALQKNNDNAHYYFFTEEEMNAYGIGNSEGLTEAQIGAEHHNSWVLSFRNVNGVMDWLWAQSK